MIDRCERVRDQLPALAAGRLDAAAAAEVRSHIDACADCADELIVVQALAAHAVSVPAGLEDLVLGAVARPGRARAGRWAPARLAMAATVVFALITAGLLRGGARTGGRVALDAGTPATAVTAAGEVDALASPAWPAVDEPLMRGGPALYELSEEELELLLKELESS